MSTVGKSVIAGRTPVDTQVENLGDKMDSIDINNVILHAMTPIVDIFWSLVWSATGSTLSVPRPSAPDAA